MKRPSASLSRSEQMSRIRGRDTKPEVSLRRLLWRRGCRCRVHFKTPAGRADLAFVGKKVAIFVDGCFWHGCPEHYVAPRTSRPFWERKLRTNVERDQRQTQVLGEAGWKVLRFWEHEVVEDPDAIAACIERCLGGCEEKPGPRPRVVAVEFLDDAGKMERRHLQSLYPAEELGAVVRERSTRKWNRRAKKSAPSGFEDS